MLVNVFKGKCMVVRCLRVSVRQLDVFKGKCTW